MHARQSINTAFTIPDSFSGIVLFSPIEFPAILSGHHHNTHIRFRENPDIKWRWEESELMTRSRHRIHLRQLRVNHCEPKIDAFDIPSSCGASWRSKSIGLLRRLDLSPSLIRRERIDLSRKLIGP